MPGCAAPPTPNEARRDENLRYNFMRMIDNGARLTTYVIEGPRNSGVIGTFDLSWSITKESPHYVQVFGSEGTLQVGWSGSKYRQDGSSKWVPFGTGYDKLKAFARQLANFIGCLKGREVPVITAEDSLASVQVVETAYHSADRDNWLKVEPPG